MNRIEPRHSVNVLCSKHGGIGLAYKADRIMHVHYDDPREAPPRRPALGTDGRLGMVESALAATAVERV